MNGTTHDTAVQQAHEPFVINGFGDRFLYSVNRGDFEARGANAVFNENYQTSLFQEKKLYIVIGSDSGLLPEYIKDKGLPRGSKYIFVECADVISAVPGSLLADDKRLKFSSIDDLESILITLGDLGAEHYFYSDNVEVLQSVGARSGHRPEYRDFSGRVAMILSRFHTRVIQGFSNSLHLQKEIENCPDTAVSAEFLEDLFTGKTAVILAAGPSLENDISWVKENRDNLVVIAITRICERLSEIGLKPDIIVGADPVIEGFEIGKGAFLFPDVLLAHTAYMHPTLTGQWPGMRAALTPRVPWNSKLNDYTSLYDVGTTVTNIAINLAGWLGVERIILLGVDFCHSPEGHSHSKGNPERSKPPVINPDIVELPTNDGSIGYGIQDYAWSAEALAIQAGNWRSRGVSIVNPAPKAVKIPDVDFCSLAELQLSPLDEAASSVLTRVYPQVDVEEYEERVIKEFERVSSLVKKTKSKAEKGLAILERHQDGSKLAQSEFDLISKTRKSFQEVPEAATIVTLFWDDFLSVPEAYEGSDDSLESAIAAQIEYFKAFIVSSKKMENFIGAIIDKARVRIEECLPEPDFQRLIKQWMLDDQHARAKMWLENNPTSIDKIDREVKAKLDELVNSFESALASDVFYYTAKLQKGNDLDNVFQRVSTLFNTKNIDGFEYLLRILNEYPEEEAAPYIAYTAGMLAEVRQDVHSAMQHYHAVLEYLDSPVLERALKRLAALCLEQGDFENAIICFESLAALSVEYVPQYGELLGALGQYENAVAVYEAYLSENYSDALTMYKLGCLHKENGNIDIAKQIQQEIEKIAPDFELSKELVS
ncbi:MAG: 6-hydroxymethylpterin diphosphokinase MptE-like protein [Sedimenticola sp.]